jgi:hypothetical protein
VLARTRFGDDSGFTQPFGEQDLPDGIVHFMCTGMAQVFPFQVDPGVIFIGEPLGILQGGRPSHRVF